MVKKASDKKRPTRTAAADVVSREYTINMHKRLHGVYDTTAHTAYTVSACTHSDSKRRAEERLAARERGDIGCSAWRHLPA